MGRRPGCTLALVACLYACLSSACGAGVEGIPVGSVRNLETGAWSAAEPWLGSARYVPTLFPARQAGEWGFINGEGELVIEFRYEDAQDFSDGMAAVRVGDEWGYIDESGVMAIEPRFDSAYPFNDGLAQVMTPSGIGYMDKTGELVIPNDPAWRDAFCFSEGLAGVWFAAGGVGYIDTDGETVIYMPQATAVRDFSEGLAAARVGGAYGYVDRTGEFVIEPQFRSGVTEFSDGLAVVEHDFLRYEVIDRTGRVVAVLDYDGVTDLRQGRAAVLVGSWLTADTVISDRESVEYAWGYMDESGALVVPTRFRLAQNYAGGLARVDEEDGKMAYIDLEGNYVWREE
jgi:hypothetical protein